MERAAPKRVFPSELDPIDPSKYGTKRTMKVVASALELIFAGRSEEIAFCEVSRRLYYAASFKHSKRVVALVRDKFRECFHNDITKCFESYDVRDNKRIETVCELLRACASIRERFECISDDLSVLMSSLIEVYGSRTSMLEMLREDFMTCLNESDCYGIIINAIGRVFSKFLKDANSDRVLETDEFRSMMVSKDLLDLASHAKAEKLVIQLKRLVRQSVITLLNEFDLDIQERSEPEKRLEDDTDEDSEEDVRETSIFDVSCSVPPSSKTGTVDMKQEVDDICKIIREYSVRVRSMARCAERMTLKLLGDNAAVTVRAAVDEMISDVHNPVFMYCLSKVGMLVKFRKEAELREFLMTLGSFQGTISMFVERITTSIESDVCSFDELSDAIEFYQKVCSLFVSYPAVQSKIESAIKCTVNADRNGLITKLIRAVHSEAKSDTPDISKFARILVYLEDKSSFDLYHLRFAGERLTKGRDLQVTREQKVMKQIASISRDFDVSNLSALIKQAVRSAELHFGPVLIINSTAWPMKPPYPSPRGLVSLVESMTTAYRRQFRNHIIRFPVNSWIVSVRDTCRDVVYEGTGVQAEILLFLNNHKIVTESSLEPCVQQNFAAAAIASLATSRVPLLCMHSEGAYQLNDDMKTVQRVVKLPTPVMRVDGDSMIVVANRKRKMIESHIVQHMKHRRIMNLQDLERMVRDDLTRYCPVSVDDMRKGLETLKSKGFVEYMKNNKVKYIA